MILSYLSTKLVPRERKGKVSVRETDWWSRYQWMEGGGLPAATHFRERNGPAVFTLKLSEMTSTTLQDLKTVVWMIITVVLV